MRLAHGRSRLCHPRPARRRLRTAAPTAESGRVVRSSGPYGPLHRRPRLRHRTRRRGDASAASRPTQSSRTSGHQGTPVSAAARGPVSAALRRRRRWTAPAHRWTARPRSGPPSARQRARTAATPCLTSLPPGGPHVLVPGPAPVSASPCRGTADGAWGLARRLLPGLPSHKGFQLHRGRHRRPPVAVCTHKSPP
jgi:hypothetical protein